MPVKAKVEVPVPIQALLGDQPKGRTWERFLTESCEINNRVRHKSGPPTILYTNGNSNYILLPNQVVVQNFGPHGANLLREIRQRGWLPILQELIDEMNSLTRDVGMRRPLIKLDKEGRLVRESHAQTEKPRWAVYAPGGERWITFADDEATAIQNAIPMLARLLDMTLSVFRQAHENKLTARRMPDDVRENADASAVEIRVD